MMVQPSTLRGSGPLVVIAVALAGWCCSLAPSESIQNVPSALACGRRAIGNGADLATVTSLSIEFDVTPDPSDKFGRHSVVELVLDFPNSFKRTDRMPLPGRDNFAIERGFTGDKELAVHSQEGTGKPSAETLRASQKEFVRWALILLLRDHLVIPVRWSEELKTDKQWVAVTATGADDFNLTLRLDRVNCLPVAAVWDRASNFGDGMNGRESSSGRHVVQYELSEYKDLGGIKLPTRIVTATDGKTDADWSLTRSQLTPKR